MRANKSQLIALIASITISVNCQSAELPIWLNKAIAGNEREPPYAYTYEFDDGRPYAAAVVFSLHAKIMLKTIKKKVSTRIYDLHRLSD